MAFWARLFGRHRPQARVVGVHRVDAAIPTCLLEVIAQQVKGRFQIRDFTQPLPRKPRDYWQAPYDAKFLNEAGDQITGDVVFDGGDANFWVGTIRLAFFFHLLDSDKPLQSPFGDLPLPAPTPWPKRLRVMKYVAPD